MKRAMKCIQHWAGMLLVGAGLLACQGEIEAPTHTVQKGPFSHRITVEGTLNAAQATVLGVPSGIQEPVRVAWLAPDGAHVTEGQVVARFDRKPLEEKLEQGSADLQSANLEVGKSQVESGSRIAKHETELEVAELELDYSSRYQKVDEVIFSRIEIIESQIQHELASHRKDHATVSQDIQRQLADTEIELLAIDQRRARNKIEQAQASLEALEVKAPHSGILTLKRDRSGEVLQVGAELWPSQQVAEIPNLEQMEAEVFVLEADAGGVEVGQQADIVLEAQPGRVISGQVHRIDAVAKRRFRGSPVQYFGVVLRFDMPEGEVLKPNQRVSATLKLEDVDEALVVPRQAVFQTEGQHYVYLRQADGFLPRPVTIGSSSVSKVIIDEGLQAGDRIALVRPTDSPPFEPVPKAGNAQTASNQQATATQSAETQSAETRAEKTEAAPQPKIKPPGAGASS